MNYGRHGIISFSKAMEAGHIRRRENIYLIHLISSFKTHPIHAVEREENPRENVCLALVPIVSTNPSP